MSLPQTNSKNASFDDNQIPSLLIKDASTNETVAVTNGSGSPSTTPTGTASVPLASTTQHLLLVPSDNLVFSKLIHSGISKTLSERQ